MAHLKNIFPITRAFLDKLQSLHIIKEFSLQPLQSSESKVEEFINICKKFIEDAKDASIINDSPQKIKVEDSPVELNASSNDKSTANMKSMIQLQADEEEIHRRITAFVTRKRKEIDESNVREFCSQHEIPDEDSCLDDVFSCARVDAAYIPRSGSKSHVKVSKVQNMWGPQTHAPTETFKKIKTEPGTENENVHASFAFDAVNERLKNMESHLNLTSENPMKITSFQNVFQRLKQLENRILYLEGISPDYFHLSNFNTASPKKNIQDKEKLYSTWGIDDIERRIQVLRESLRAKASVKKETIS